MHRVAVIGAGTMGHGIAQVCASAGFTVHVSDPSEGAREKGIKGVRDSLDRMVAKARLTAETASSARRAGSRG